MKHGKKYVDAAKLVDRTKLYDSGEALDTVIKTATAKFDETVELHVKLGVDSRHADQQVRGAVVLPNGTGKNVRVLAICKGANEDLAKEAGADYVGAEDMTQKIQQENWMDFDVLITTPDCMGLVGRLGRILGPRGLMRQVLLLLTSQRLLRKQRQVRLNTVLTKQTSFTAPSAR